MRVLLNRRAMLLAVSLLLAATTGAAALAQDKPVLRFSAVFSEQDIRAEMTKKFAADIKNDFTLEPYFGGTLFKQGTELVALQRDTSRSATSRRRTSRSSFPPGRSSPLPISSETRLTCGQCSTAMSAAS